METDSFETMTEAVSPFHRKHRFRELGGEEFTYRISLMAEELGEISRCVTQGPGESKLAEVVADLLVLVLGTGIAQDIDLSEAFWSKMAKLEKREARLIEGPTRVSEFQGKSDG
jgi:NTP pyrophosphatase (non-canonical NTP hydrolase)